MRGYPNSQYATDAYKRMVFLKDRLAKYELSVVDYYTDRGAWVAVVNRVEGMMRNYPDTGPPAMPCRRWKTPIVRCK